MGRYGITGRAVLVTGGANGIGKAISTLCAEEGAFVAVMDVHRDSLQAHMNSLRERGFTAIGIIGDVADPADCQHAVAETVHAFGKLNILFANAGIPLVRSVVDVDAFEVDKIIDTNLKGVIYICKYAVPELIRANGGAIVTTGSEMAFAADPANPVYDATKAAVVMFTKSLALDLIRYGIRVNSVCPGITNTNLLQEEVAASPNPDARQRENEAWAPIGRIADPMEIAHPAVFLASDLASFMVGSAVLVDGGFTAK